MVKPIEEFRYNYFEYYLIQKEEIPMYLERYYRFLVLTLDDVHKASNSDELMFLGYEYIKRDEDEDKEKVLQKFLHEIKEEKLNPYPELTIDDLVFYVGNLQWAIL